MLSLLLLLLIGASGAAAAKTTISFWYAIGSNAGGRVFQEMVDEFNATHDHIYVDAVYTGNYGETAQKVTASLAADTLPTGGVDSGHSAIHRTLWQLPD